jgi:hypothetical protein
VVREEFHVFDAVLLAILAQNTFLTFQSADLLGRANSEICRDFLFHKEMPLSRVNSKLSGSPMLGALALLGLLTNQTLVEAVQTDDSRFVGLDRFFPHGPS